MLRMIAKLALMAVAALAAQAAQADIKIGSVLSVTGPASFLGDPEKKTLTIRATIKKAKPTAVELTFDADERIVRAGCQCHWHQHNQLFKGPCEHILALRVAHARRWL